jgi:hypothetical protein
MMMANVKEALNIVLQKTTITPTTYALTLKDFANFVESQGPFFDTPLVKDLDLLPHDWWDLTKVNGCTLALIAHRILAQVCSASSCEQNWSSYSFIHSKIQNQLTLN